MADALEATLVVAAIASPAILHALDLTFGQWPRLRRGVVIPR